MKRQLLTIGILFLSFALTSCSKSDDCECETTDYLFYQETKTVEDEESGEEYVDTIDRYDPISRRDFLFEEWGEDCKDITLQDIPESANLLFADSCSITCKGK